MPQLPPDALDHALVGGNIPLGALLFRRVIAEFPFGDQQGRFEVLFADGLRVLGETPPRRRFGVLAKILAAKGSAHLDLDLAIPLLYKGRKGPLRLAGELSWPGPATLIIPDLDITLTNLTGKLRFTERDL